MSARFVINRSLWSMNLMFGREPTSKRTRLSFAALDDRIVPATFQVTVPSGIGAGTIYDCVAKANANPGKDTIEVNVNCSVLWGEMSINDAVTIKSPRAPTYLNASQLNRIFNTSAATAKADIS